MPSLIEAIEKKYCYDEFACDKHNENITLFAPEPKFLTSIPSNLILDKCEVSNAGELSKLQEVLRKVQELHLSHNTIEEWDEIFKIFKSAPVLSFVNLSFNNLSNLLMLDDLLHEITFPRLHTLALVGTSISFENVMKLLRIVDHVQELHLSKNAYHDFNYEDACENFPTVKKLMVDGNNVCSWRKVSKLSALFPNLVHLNLSDCPLNVEEDCCGTFLNLEYLNISGTAISKLEEIDYFNKLSKLTEIRTIGIPFLQNAPEKGRRQELIAILGNVIRVNGGQNISLEERDTAERYFVRKYSASDTNRPSRYYELLNKHGELPPLVEVNLKPEKEVTVKVIISDQKQIIKKLNLYHTVKKLKKDIEKEAGIPATHMLLYHLDVGMNMGREVMRFPDKQLYTYRINDGDEIHVEPNNACIKTT